MQIPEHKQPEAFPVFLKDEQRGIYIRFTNDQMYHLLKVIDHPDNYYFALMKTICTQSEGEAILNEYGYDRTTEAEYMKALKRYCLRGVTIMRQIDETEKGKV